MELRQQQTLLFGVASSAVIICAHPLVCILIVAVAMKDNQFRLGADNANDLDAVFEERLLSTGRMLALLDTLENPLCECPFDFVCSL